MSVCRHHLLCVTGYTKRVMVIYNGVHYDALAISPGPRSVQEEDATEFNPRTKRGKMIIAAAQKLVRLAVGFQIVEVENTFDKSNLKSHFK